MRLTFLLGKLFPEEAQYRASHPPVKGVKNQNFPLHLWHPWNHVRQFRPLVRSSPVVPVDPTNSIQCHVSDKYR